MGIRDTKVWRDSAYLSPARKVWHLGAWVLAFWMGVSSPCRLNALQLSLLKSENTSGSLEKDGAEQMAHHALSCSFPVLIWQWWRRTTLGEGWDTSRSWLWPRAERQALQKWKSRLIIQDGEGFLLLWGMMLISSLLSYFQRWDN